MLTYFESHNTSPHSCSACRLFHTNRFLCYSTSRCNPLHQVHILYLFEVVPKWISLEFQMINHVITKWSNIGYNKTHETGLLPDLLTYITGGL